MPTPEEIIAEMVRYGWNNPDGGQRAGIRNLIEHMREWFAATPKDDVISIRLAEVERRIEEFLDSRQTVAVPNSKKQTT